MARYSDLQPLDYFGKEAAASLRAIGWLERGDTFVTGEVQLSVFGRLRELLLDPFAPFAFGGAHPCNLCVYTPEARGTRNLFVPGTGFLYVCPELILHYMNVHRYAPPEEFAHAVLACPDQRTLNSGGFS